jgi:hypothetical protein
MLLLLGAVGVHSMLGIALTAILLGFGIPASRFVAHLVENKKFTFTSNGAIFVSLVILPWVVNFLNRVSAYYSASPIPIVPAMAAGAIAYAYGESFGRMACISFGCCYGRRIDSLPRLLQKILLPLSITFEGRTKKAAYEGGMEGIPLVPIQAMMSGFCFLCALAGTWLYFRCLFSAAFVVTIAATQIWRFASESLRADYRGPGRITGYQVMALAMVAYSFGLAAMLSSQPGCVSNLILGIRSLWNPAVLLFVEVLWGAAFIYYGRSKVTSSTLSIHVREDRI